MLPLIALAVAAAVANVMAVVNTITKPPTKQNSTVQMLEINTKDLKLTEEELEESKMPTQEQYENAKAMLEDPEGKFYHFAVAGVSGSGKSSLVNALRGLRNYDESAAKTGVTETTMQARRHPDHNSLFRRFVWYDIPGAGTMNIPTSQYFNEQGLFIFDFVIVTVNDRFTEIDMQILRQCRQKNIPAFVVRSKADQHIRNMMEDRGVDKNVAREIFITDSHTNIMSILNLMEMEDAVERIYIVSAHTLRSIILTMTEKMEYVTDKAADETVNKEEEIKNAIISKNDIIDEMELIKDLIWTAKERRS